ncbi:competence CoiA-like predicted nuclease [Bacillus oleivorans]|uniref:Competence CoiA-like predicted nuclease n=1 Tax=Bacillus oleivorans TaxID=1448271 RepID=A0A285D2X4_9BACI|nr:competence protein CoiA family protein [Bacillus oleivorans]SNX74171.1 competence CoiA-like predicted nuclease [Bacillus oleivorans]
MFVAINQNGHIYSLIGKSREEIIPLRQQEFYCPGCKQKVQLKIGEINHPHFSHIQYHRCPFEWEPESEQHIDGKLLLQTFFQNLGWKTELEVYLKAISQKPDLLLKKGSQQFAIEYQCSPLTLSRLRERVEGYSRLGIKQKWFFAPSLIKSQSSSSSICLSEIVITGLVWNDPYFHLWCLDPDNRKLILFHHIFPFSQKKIFALQTPYSLLDQPPLITTPSSKSIIRSWKQERIKWLLTPNVSKKSSDLQFYRYLYQKSVHRSLLPPFVGIPHLSLPYIKTPAPIWQAYVCLELYQILQRKESISREHLIHLLKKRVQTGEIELRDFLFQPSSLEIPVLEYLQILVNLHVFSENENHILVGKEAQTIMNASITQDQSIRTVNAFYRDHIGSLLKVFRKSK